MTPVAPIAMVPASSWERMSDPMTWRLIGPRSRGSCMGEPPVSDGRSQYPNGAGPITSVRRARVRQRTVVDDVLRDLAQLGVGMAGVAAQQLEGLLHGELVGLHQDALGHADHVAGVQRRAQ